MLLAKSMLSSTRVGNLTLFSAARVHQKCLHRRAIQKYSRFYHGKSRRTARSSVGNSTLTWHDIRYSYGRIVPTRCRLFSTQEEDLYDRYRKSPTEEIIEELKEENHKTRDSINPKLFRQVWMELQASVTENAHPPPPEPGPTGAYLYQSVASDNGNLIYQRYKASDTESNTPQVVINVEPQLEIQGMSLTVDESCLAYLTTHSVTGTTEVHLRHIDSGDETTLQVSHPELIVSLEWGPRVRSHHSLYYVTVDSLGRPHQVYGCLVDATTLQPSEQSMIFHSENAAEIVDIQRTKGCDYVSITAMTKLSNEIYLSNDPTLPMILVREREEGFQYHVDVGDQGSIYLLASQNGSEMAVLETTVESLPMPKDQDISKLVIAASDASHAITDIDLFRDYLVLYERSTRDGRQHIHVQQRKNKEKSVNVTLSEDTMNCSKISPAGNMYYDAESLRFSVESPASPGRIYDYHLKSGIVKELSSKEVIEKEPPRDSAPDYHQERLFVTSRDGAQVPISLIYRKEAELSWSSWLGFGQPKPIVLVGYGAYGEPMNLGYDPTWIPLLERGFVLAFAHTRGGGDLGRAWYHAGRLENKTKAIEDFIACAEALKTGPFAGGALTAKAFSAGGIVVSAAVNQEPELFNNVVLTNAFCDLRATLSNPSLFLTKHEWDEYGNPLVDTKIEKVIRSYCPTSNIVDGARYPRFLLIGTVDDENVPYYNALIFARKLRDSGVDKNRVQLHVEDGGGHNLGGGHRIPVAALEVSFIVENS